MYVCVYVYVWMLTHELPSPNRFYLTHERIHMVHEPLRTVFYGISSSESGSMGRQTPVMQWNLLQPQYCELHVVVTDTKIQG